MLVILIAECWSAAQLWPQPTITFTQGKAFRSLKPSDLTLQSKCSEPHVKQLFDAYKSYYGLGGPVKVSVEIGNCQLVPAKDNEEYIVLLDNNTVSVVAEHYPGIVRGIETLFQLFEGDGDQSYVLVPTVVRDKPAFNFRGIMLDTSRHFISLPVVKQAIDGCMANKLNVFHWHIVDDDSFPLDFGGASNASTFNGKMYSKQEIKEVVRYAMVRGVRVVPEIDTPSHSGSWKAALNSSTVVICNSIYGQFDPTLNETYNTMLRVIKDTLELFPDQYLHLGGDEVDQSCWDKVPAIKTFMAQNNIPNYNALQLYYRKRQKSLLRTITNKTFLYWGNSLKQLDWFEDDDVLHWWGNIGNNDATNGTVAKSAKKVVLSYMDKSYLSYGFAGSTVMTWRRLYQNRWGFPWSNATVLGGVAALWSEINNDFTTSVKLWMRSSALAQRLWNPTLFLQNSTNYNGILRRLSAQRSRMQRRGMKVAPLTVQICEGNSSFCFKQVSEEQE